MASTTQSKRAVQLRQGDVYLVPVEAPGSVNLPKAKRVEPENGRTILAYGEATGHHHSLDSATTALYEWPGTGKRVLVVDQATPLTHQEHATLDVAPGMYWVVAQREYTPGAVRRVLD